MADDISRSWRRLCCEVVLAKHYPHTSMLDGLFSSASRNPLLEKLLPSLLYVKMVAELDYGLQTYIDREGLTMPGRYRDLNGRINFLHDNGRVNDRAECHRIRHRRNQLAHEANQHADWQELEKDVAILHSELEHLGLVGPWEELEFFGERSQMRDSDDPGVAFAQDITCGVKLGGEWVYSFRTTKSYHNSEGG